MQPMIPVARMAHGTIRRHTEQAVRGVAVASAESDGKLEKDLEKNNRNN